MTETPLPARVAALRLTTPPSYNLRNREIPRDDPAGSETPTLNLRSRSVVRDSPAPLKTGGEQRDAFREFEKHFETAKEFSRKAVRRTVRWWNGSGWAMRAAVACWGIALLLWLVNSSDSSTNAGPATVIPPANVPPVVVTAPVKQQEPVVEPKPVAKPIPEPAKPVEVVAPQPASLGSAFGPANRTPEASTQTTDDTPDPEPLPIPEPEPEPPKIAEFTSLFKVDGKGTSDTFALLPSGPASYWFAKIVDWMFGWNMVLAEGKGPQVVLQGGKGCWPVKVPGKLTLTLPKPLTITSFSLANTNSPSSPKLLTIRSIRQNKPQEILATITPTASNITVEAKRVEKSSGIEIRVLENGGAAYACLSGIKVFGEVDV